ncbi:MAG: hypothetical protein ACMUHY_08715 [Thermoplasmatota archaeon]
MDRREVLTRIGGVFLTLSGIAMIIVSGKLVPYADMGLGDRPAEFMLRAGFGILLMGILIVFLFSFRTVPKELIDPILFDRSRDMGRLLEALELKGNGVYVPKGGRLKEERVYVPAEEKPLPLPGLVAEQVLIVGTTGSSMGVSLIPPGSGLVDRIETDTKREFREDELPDIQESLERLSRGSGLIGSISARSKGERIHVEIVHSRFREVCDRSWKDQPQIHSKTGCPGCSAVISAVARVSGSPLRIGSVEREGRRVVYLLERW